MSIFILVGTVILFLAADFVVMRILKRRRAKLELQLQPIEAAINTGLKTEDIQVPAGLFYYHGHTWAELKPSGEIRVGITDFAQKIFEKVDKIKLQTVGKMIDQGDEAFVISHKGRKAKFRSPISGEITKVNSALKSNPAMVKKNPYSKGWIYSIKPKSFSEEMEGLTIGEEATSWIKGEVNRLKEFILEQFTQDRVLSNTLADGGLIVDGITKFLDDESWEKLQSKFLG